jgi:hypothetical protein
MNNKRDYIELNDKREKEKEVELGLNDHE